MPRKMRVQYCGAMYHFMSRGDRREDFRKTLAEACQKTDWQVHGYSLMRNHYHLVLETPNANLVAGIAWLQSAYTIRLNSYHRHDRLAAGIAPALHCRFLPTVPDGSKHMSVKAGNTKI